VAPGTWRSVVLRRRDRLSSSARLDWTGAEATMAILTSWPRRPLTPGRGCSVLNNNAATASPDSRRARFSRRPSGAREAEGVARLGRSCELQAERSKLSPNYIGTVESGHRDPSLSTVLALAKALRVPAGELVGGIEDVSAEALEAARLFQGCTPIGSRSSDNGWPLSPVTSIPCRSDSRSADTVSTTYSPRDRGPHMSVPRGGGSS
jgi:transcriptional regulator with XRE-family HTH domain